MRDIFRQVFHKKRYAIAWPLCDEEKTGPDMHPQRGSPLFDKLSPEIRLMIYSAVLVDQHRFLHICQNVERRKRRQFAHEWCQDMDSPFPTWQHHICYGESRHIVPGKFNAFQYRTVTETDHRLLSLLLACRLMYSEALSVLYQENTFHFRGSTSLCAFASSLSPVQWTAIRRVHVSTLFQHDWLLNRQNGVWMPDNIHTWKKACEYLSRLPRLETLTIDLIVKIVHRDEDMSYGEQRILQGILSPLKAIEAEQFEVELNLELSDDTMSALGAVEFLIVHKERPLNMEIYTYGYGTNLEIE